MKHFRTQLSRALPLVLAALNAARCFAGATEDPRVAYANKVLAEYRKDAPKNERVLHVAYFCPADRSPAPNYQARLEQVLGEISRYYAEQMHGYGLASDGLPLDKDGNGKLIIHLVTGKQPASEYSEAKSAGEIREDVQPVMAKAGVELDNNHVVVFTRLGNFDGTNTWHNSPYCGMGWGRAGFCWQFDSDILSIPNLQVTNQWVTDRQYGHINFGRYNSIFIGGIAHELGHCFGLPHNAQTDAELRERGHALMGDGNRHLWEEVRNDGKGSFLTLAHALALAGNPLFSHYDKGLEEPWECTVQETVVTTTNRSARLTGRFKSNQPVYGVIAYADPEGRSNYDAVSYAGTVDADGRFAVDLTPMPRSDKQGEIRICLLTPSGQHLNASRSSQFNCTYTVGTDGNVSVQLP